MHKDPFVFAQLVQFMNRSKFNRIVAKYDGDKYVKSFTCWNQLLMMMFGQLTNRESLRDLIVATEAHPDKEAFKDKPKTGEYIKVFIEEDGRVYSQDDNYQQIYVDMNIEDNKAFGFMPVEHDDYIDSPMGRLRRVYFTSFSDNKDVYHPLAMIEGVGSSNSFVGQPLLATDGGNHIRMTAFYYNDELVFTEEDFSPFPVGVEEIEVEKAAVGSDDAPYYDLMGQRVKNPVPGSILIHNGCKVVYR